MDCYLEIGIIAVIVAFYGACWPITSLWKIILIVSPILHRGRGNELSSQSRDIVLLNFWGVLRLPT